MSNKNIVRIEDYQQNETTRALLLRLDPLERLIWFYIQTNIRDSDSDESLVFQLKNMVKHGWISSEEALEVGCTLLEKLKITG